MRLPSPCLVGIFLQNGDGNVSLGGGIETDDADITFERAVTLTATGPVTLESDGGNIVFERMLASTSDFGESLTLDAGSGSILFTEDVGSETIALSDLDITGASGGVTVTSGIYAKSVSIASTISRIKCSNWGFQSLINQHFNEPNEVIEFVMGLKDGVIQKTLPEYNNY